MNTLEIKGEYPELLHDYGAFLSIKYEEKLEEILDVLEKSLNVAESINDHYRIASAKVELGRFTIYKNDKKRNKKNGVQMIIGI